MGFSLMTPNRMAGQPAQWLTTRWGVTARRGASRMCPWTALVQKKRSPVFWQGRTLAQALLELAEDYAPVYQRLERLRLRDDPAALTARFTQQLQKWETDDRFVRHQDAAAFGRDLDVWVAQVQREVLPRFPGDAMTLFAAFLDVDRVVFERVDDDGGYVVGAFELACRLWLTAAAAAGLSTAEIADRVATMLFADNYGARAALGKRLVR